jgi:glycosyltransferase involved in cell wall biosynthesis
MKIGIDARSMSIKGGVRNYILNLVKEISKIDKNNEYHIYYDSEKNLGSFNYKKFKETLIKNNSRILIPFWEQIKLRNRIIKDKINVFHGMKNTVPIWLPKNIKSIATIHDLTPFIFKKEVGIFDYFYWKFFIPRTIKKASRIIVISESTRRDVKELFPKYKEKIELTYLGRPSKKINPPLAKKNFFLIVGAMRPRKNLIGVVKAFKEITKKYPSFKLYLVGKDFNNYKKIVEMEVKKLGIEKNVLIKGYASQNDLNRYYSFSKGYIFTSLYEGFGLPILEAQSRGCPVVTSNISSMPEISGEGAILVDPYKINEISKAMSLLIEDKNLTTSIVKKGYKNLKRFSWKKTAKETLEIYKNVKKI